MQICFRQIEVNKVGIFTLPNNELIGVLMLHHLADVETNYEFAQHVCDDFTKYLKAIKKKLEKSL